MDHRVKPGGDDGSMTLEKLHGALVLLRGGTAAKGAEIAPPAGLRIDFARIEPVFAGGELANHGGCSGYAWNSAGSILGTGLAFLGTNGRNGPAAVNREFGQTPRASGARWPDPAPRETPNGRAARM